MKTKNFEQFRKELADAIDEALIVDEVGDYNFSVEDAVERVLDVLEDNYMLTFTNDC